MITSDYAISERQRKLSNSQPLRVNWVAVWAYFSAFVLSGAIWRCIYLFALRVCR